MQTVQCQLCSYEGLILTSHLVEVHGVDPKSYQGDLYSKDLEDAALGSRVQRSEAPNVTDLSVTMGEYQVPVNHLVAGLDCLPVPAKYRVPQYGALSRDVKDAMIALLSGENVYIHGQPGCGKDALLHAFCGMSRRASKLFQVLPGTNIEAWLYSRGIDPSHGDCWREGELLTALRDGYTDRMGNVHPYTILITDFDRADPSQAEILRLIMDSISGRVPGPQGVTYDLYPGTQIVCTGNSCGTGDETGMCVSSNPMDASILDRFDAIFRFNPLDWKDEGLICKAKFPLLLEKAPGAFDQVGSSVKAIREEIQKGLFFEMSHRAVCRWLRQAENTIRITGKVPKGLLKRSARAFTDGASDQDTRDKLKKLIDPHLLGGSLDLGGSLEDGDLADVF
jgi:hypothetical protein